MPFDMVAYGFVGQPFSKQLYKAPTKRHFDERYPNIFGRNMLRAFGLPVVTCWVLQIELVRMPWRNIVARMLVPRGHERFVTGPLDQI